MIGGGFAFAMLPVLRRLFHGDRLEEAVARHCEHFNAHPYLAGLALGAAARLEADGADPDLVRRFKTAIKGPLGAMGDGLIWAAWLPVTALLGLIAYFVGLPPLVCVLVFLIPYNLGHIALRAWGFQAGLTWGREVGRVLRDAGIARRTEWVSRLGSVLLGALAGLLGVDVLHRGALANLWLALSAAAFVAGFLGGLRAWRPAALIAVGTVVAILTVAAP